MPQMSSMDWFLLMIYFLMIFYMLYVMIYFLMYFKLKNNMLKISLNNFFMNW